MPTCENINNYSDELLVHTLQNNVTDRQRIRHLYRRLGYGARLDDITAATTGTKTIDALVEELIEGAVSTTFPEDFDWGDRLMDYPSYNTNGNTFGNYDSLIHNYWINELIQEGIRSKLTLFWRNHFVASKEAPLVRLSLRYYELLFDNAFGNFKEFVKKIGRDGVMLKYLNGNRSEGEPSGNYTPPANYSTYEPRIPNENYARELLELFTMGITDKAGNSNYTEEDISTLAKVFTGWGTGFFTWTKGIKISGISTVNATTSGAVDGSITIYASESLPIDTEYSIDNGITFSSDNVFTGLEAGSYKVGVRDNKYGCLAFQEVIINNNDEGFVLDFTIEDAPCEGTPFGQVIINNLTPEMGALRYSFGGTLTIYPFRNLVPGTHTVQVLDYNDRIIASEEVTVGNFIGPYINNISSYKANCNSNTGRINLQLNWIKCAAGAIEYSIDNGVNFYPMPADGIILDLYAGFYTVTIKDATGYTHSKEVIINEYNGPSIYSINPTKQPNCNGTGGVITINSNGSQYSIDNGLTFQTSNVFTDLSAGTYKVVAKSASGCKTYNTITLYNNQYSGYIHILGVATIDANCNASDGSLTIYVDPTTINGSAEYSIDGGLTFQSGNAFTNLIPGAYTTVVRDDSGCTITLAAVINTLPFPDYIPLSHRPTSNGEYYFLSGVHDWTNKKLLSDDPNLAFNIDIEGELKKLFCANLDTEDEDCHPKYTQLITGLASAYLLNGERVVGTPLSESTYIEDPDTFVAITFNKYQGVFYDNKVTKFGIGCLTAADWEYNKVHDIIFENREETIAYFICKKLYEFYIYGDTSSTAINQTAVDAYITALANTFRNNDWEIKPVLKQLFKSQHFYDPGIMGIQIKSHIGSAVSLLRLGGLAPGWGQYDSVSNDYGYQYRFELLDPAITGVDVVTGEGGVYQDVADGKDILENSHTLLIKNRCALTGQDLDAPPDVNGWNEHHFWLNEGALLKRRVLLFQLLNEELANINDANADDFTGTGPLNKLRLLAIELNNEPLDGTYFGVEKIVRTVWRHFMCTEPTDRQITDGIAAYSENWAYPWDPTLDGYNPFTQVYDTKGVALQVSKLLVYLTEQPEWHLT